jgi:hypothetical protein
LAFAKQEDRQQSFAMPLALSGAAAAFSRGRPTLEPARTRATRA